MSRDMQLRIPRLLDKKPEVQEELRLEDLKRDPRRFNPRIAKLCQVALKQLKKGESK